MGFDVLQEMKTIARILEINCFLAAFLAFAFCLTLTFGVEGYLPTIEWLVALATLSFALGFGEISRDKAPTSKLLFLLIFASVLFGSQLVLSYVFEVYPGLSSMSFIEKSKHFFSTLAPEFRSDQVLGSVSVFYIDLIRYWMPMVLVACFAAIGICYPTQSKKIKEAEQGTDGDAEEAV